MPITSPPSRPAPTDVHQAAKGSAQAVASPAGTRAPAGTGASLTATRSMTPPSPDQD
ncbi:hypothetical protein AB0442_06310 [Kitasatospora sp. NPDC085895]|uniref:hypothetical protein n=1 Tax=Kitasatospora sp. NPDC085895 TaxID=3155057 RepID=UPI00344B21A0